MKLTVRSKALDKVNSLLPTFLRMGDQNDSEKDEPLVTIKDNKYPVGSVENMEISLIFERFAFAGSVKDILDNGHLLTLYRIDEPYDTLSQYSERRPIEELGKYVVDIAINRVRTTGRTDSHVRNFDTFEEVVQDIVAFADSEARGEVAQE